MPINIHQWNYIQTTTSQEKEPFLTTALSIMIKPAFIRILSIGSTVTTTTLLANRRALRSISSFSSGVMTEHKLYGKSIITTSNRFVISRISANFTSPVSLKCLIFSLVLQFENQTQIMSVFQKHTVIVHSHNKCKCIYRSFYALLPIRSHPLIFQMIKAIGLVLFDCSFI